LDYWFHKATVLKAIKGWKVTVQEKKWALTEGLDPEGHFYTEKEKKIKKSKVEKLVRTA